MACVNIIVAATPTGGIGMDGKLPWELPGDMAYFREVTMRTKREGTRNAVVMGRKTWASIPAKFRPLKGRINLVLSSSSDESALRVAEGIPAEVLVSSSLAGAMSALSSVPDLASIFVIGGASAFSEALSGITGIICDTVYLTRVLVEKSCDVFIPPLDDSKYALDELQVSYHSFLEHRQYMNLIAQFFTLLCLSSSVAPPPYPPFPTITRVAAQTSA